eukprot:52641_1
MAVKQISKSKLYSYPSFNKKRKALIQAMKTEIEIMRRLNHRHIINMQQVYETKHSLYIVMDECKGGELAQKLLQQDHMSEEDTKAITRMICKALLYMHDTHGAMHLDLKPENILFVDSSPTSDIKLIDFGSSKLLSTNDDVCGGTIYYTAPEAINGAMNPCSDMWSVGVIAFLMLFGAFPFFVDSCSGSNESEEVRQLILDGFNPTVQSGFGAWFPESMSASVSADGLDFISRLLVTDTTKRLTAKDALNHPWLSSHRRLGLCQPCSPMNARSKNKQSSRENHMLIANVIFLIFLTSDALRPRHHLLLFLMCAKWMIVLFFVYFTFN